MTSATVQLNIILKRMLTRKEAAHHCGRSLRRFNIECPVSPVLFPNGDERFDMKDLDGWLDTLKGTEVDIDSILASLT